MNKLPGIYKIVNKVTRDVYVGSSNDLKYRKTRHFCNLRGNRHINKHMQNSWNKYGEISFEFKVLLICDPENLTLFEQRAADVIKPVFNKRIITESNRGFCMSESAKQAISKKLKGRKVGGRKRKDEIIIKKEKYKFTIEHRKNISKNSSVAKLWDTLISPEGIEYKDIFNMEKFCRENGLHIEGIKRVYSGLRKHHAGWYVKDRLTDGTIVKTKCGFRYKPFIHELGH